MDPCVCVLSARQPDLHCVYMLSVAQLFFFMASSTELVRDGRTDTHMWLLGWFQSVNSRSAGLQVFDLKRIAKVMLVIYGFFMWLNPFPIVMAMEREQLMFEGHPIVSQVASLPVIPFPIISLSRPHRRNVVTVIV